APFMVSGAAPRGVKTDTIFLSLCPLCVLLDSLLNPTVIFTAIPTCPLLASLGPQQFPFRLETPHSSFTQVLVDSLGQIAPFDNEVSQTNLRIPDNGQAKCLTLFSNEEHIV